MADNEEKKGIALRGEDDYERDHMSPEEGVLYRDKFSAGWAWHGIMGAVTLFSVLPMLLVPEPGVIWPYTLGTVALMGLLWLLFAVLRVSVTSTRVQIQLGVFGPDIPVEQITHAEAVDYDWKTYGGWGIRKGRDGSWAYNMLGDAGRAARIEYTDERGKEHAVVVTSTEPHLLVDAIQRSRGIDTSQIEDALLVDEERDAEEEVILDVNEDLDASDQDVESVEEVEEEVAK